MSGGAESRCFFVPAARPAVASAICAGQPPHRSGDSIPANRPGSPHANAAAATRVGQHPVKHHCRQRLDKRTVRPAAAGRPSSTQQASDTAKLDGDTLKNLAVWLELGAVTDIIEWCDELTARTPELAPRMAEIRGFAECGDFASIRKCFRTVDFEGR